MSFQDFELIVNATVKPGQDFECRFDSYNAFSKSGQLTRSKRCKNECTCSTSTNQKCLKKRRMQRDNSFVETIEMELPFFVDSCYYRMVTTRQWKKKLPKYCECLQTRPFSYVLKGAMSFCCLKSRGSNSGHASCAYYIYIYV